MNTPYTIRWLAPLHWSRGLLHQVCPAQLTQVHKSWGSHPTSLPGDMLPLSVSISHWNVATVPKQQVISFWQCKFFTAEKKCNSDSEPAQLHVTLQVFLGKSKIDLKWKRNCYWQKKLPKNPPNKQWGQCQVFSWMTRSFSEYLSLQQPL